jgi:hypothetical protein
MISSKRRVAKEEEEEEGEEEEELVVAIDALAVEEEIERKGDVVPLPSEVTAPQPSPSLLDEEVTAVKFTADQTQPLVKFELRSNKAPMRWKSNLLIPESHIPKAIQIVLGSTIFTILEETADAEVLLRSSSKPDQE